MITKGRQEQDGENKTYVIVVWGHIIQDKKYQSIPLLENNTDVVTERDIIAWVAETVTDPMNDNQRRYVTGISALHPNDANW